MSALLLVVMMMSDTSEIERVCGGMVEAWYGGDAEKMESVLHPDLAKRGVLTDEKGSPVIRFADKAQMVEGARRGVGRIPREQ